MKTHQDDQHISLLAVRKDLPFECPICQGYHFIDTWVEDIIDNNNGTYVSRYRQEEECPCQSQSQT